MALGEGRSYLPGVRKAWRAQFRIYCGDDSNTGKISRGIRLPSMEQERISNGAEGS